MALPQSPNIITAGTSITSITPPPHMYSQALQVKLYQAFIFSIPILFSIILFLLFYLFYLKRRSSPPTSLPPPSPPPIHPTIFTHHHISSAPYEMDFKGRLQVKLPKVIFDEHLREKDSICCVCLGEFEMKEELVEVGLCKHLFHIDCINHWLQSNATCPLCRSSVLSSAFNLPSKSSIISTTQQQLLPPNMLVEQEASSSSSITTSTRTAGLVLRDSNGNEMDQPLSLHILVQNS